MATDTATELWGEETRKAIANFPVSGQPIPVSVVRWLGRIKSAAAQANAELGLLDPEIAERIAAAGDAIAAGEHDDQFPIDVFQTGSGTSSHTNANEVIASLAGEGVHPSDHVNMGQSSNDVFPSAVHLAALGEVTHDLLPAMDGLASALERKSEEFAEVVKAGRTHLMDAVPGHPRPGVRRLRRSDQAGHREGARHPGARRPDPARRHRHRHRPQHALGVRAARARQARRGHRAGDLRAARPLRGAGKPRRPGRALGGAEGGRRLGDEDRQRHRADGLRAPRRARGAAPAGAPEGLLDHAREGQPGDLRGRDPGRSAGDRQRRARSRSPARRASSSSTCGFR